MKLIFHRSSAMTIVNTNFILPRYHVPQTLKRLGDFANTKKRILVQQDNITCKTKWKKVTKFLFIINSLLFNFFSFKLIHWKNSITSRQKIQVYAKCRRDWQNWWPDPLKSISVG